MNLGSKCLTQTKKLEWYINAIIIQNLGILTQGMEYNPDSFNAFISFLPFYDTICWVLM